MKTTRTMWALVAAVLLAIGCSDAKKFDEDLSAPNAPSACNTGNCPVVNGCKAGETGKPVPCADGSQGFLVCGTDGKFSQTTCKPGQAPTTGCGSTSAICASGKVECGCSDGRDGTTSCLSDCSGYGPCVCTGSVPGSGGSAGSGGTSGSGGTAGQAGSGGEAGSCDAGTSGSGGTSGTGGSAGAGGSSGSGGSGGSAQNCIPLSRIDCACGGGVTGHQYCTSDGLSYGPCVECGAGGTGGSAGSGGTGGTAGAGGTAGTGGAAHVCVPGQQVACNDCSGGIEGTKKCNDDAMGYSTCDCSVGSGGSGGAAGAGGSSGSGGSGGATQNCVPLSRIDCACGGGVTGHQYCTSDGLSYGPCVECGAGGTGGSAGSGGSSGAGGSGGAAGSGGSGGSNGTVVTVTCEVTAPDNTANQTGTTNPHKYAVYLSDNGVDGNYATQNHLHWGDDLAPQQMGRYVKFTFATTETADIEGNIARDPVGTNPAADGYWHDPAVKDGKIVMKIDCVVLINGQTFHTPWAFPKLNVQGTGYNFHINAEPTAITAADSDGDGVPDANECAPNDYYRFPGAVEVEQNGVDEDCSGKDLKYVRYEMYGPSSLQQPMYATDWAKAVPMTFIHDQDVGSDLWATDYVPVEQLPTAFLVEYVGSCSGGHCWDCADLGYCQETYVVKARTSDNQELTVTLGKLGGKCRRQCDPTAQ